MPKQHDGPGDAQALVIGGGGIGRAIFERWSEDRHFDRVWGARRSGVALAELAPAAAAQGSSARTAWLKAPDSAAPDMERDLDRLAEYIADACPRLSRVAIAVGALHGDGYTPEKSLDALAAGPMTEVYRVNCILPLLWVAALGRRLRRAPDCRIAVLSARVGSLGDNRLGGWYSYRCAKAALNMGLKSAAVELARRAKGVKLLAYHPGTVDTPLSAPFQRGVPEGKLFTPDFTAARLVALLEKYGPDGRLHYLDWAGEPIPW